MIKDYEIWRGYRQIKEDYAEYGLLPIHSENWLFGKLAGEWDAEHNNDFGLSLNETESDFMSFSMSHGYVTGFVKGLESEFREQP